MANTHLIINTDGGSRGNPGPAAYGVVVKNENNIVAELSNFLGTKTNNDAEYEAILASLKWLQENGGEDLQKVEWRLDSMLVVEQLNRRWKIKEERIRQYATQAWKILEAFQFTYTISYVPRAENKEADLLVNQCLDSVSEK